MQSIRVLIVEDDPMVMEVNVEFISRIEDYEIVGKAFTGYEALNLSKELQNVDLVLLDYFLPDLDGLHVLSEIRKLNLPIDVIFVTANRSLEHIQQVKRLGAIDYIFKPFSFSRLQSTLIQFSILRRKLKHTAQLEQADLDMIMGVRNIQAQTGSSPLPKGLNERTLIQIQQFLALQKKALSSEEVALGTGLARVTARRYLEYLSSSGKVKVEVQYGSIGRPVNLYKS